MLLFLLSKSIYFFLIKVSEKEMSTVLLVFPELGLFGDYELFEAYCERLVWFDAIIYDSNINVYIHEDESDYYE